MAARLVFVVGDLLEESCLQCPARADADAATLGQRCLCWLCRGCWPEADTAASRRPWLHGIQPSRPTRSISRLLAVGSAWCRARSLLLSYCISFVDDI